MKKVIKVMTALCMISLALMLSGNVSVQSSAATKEKTDQEKLDDLYAQAYKLMDKGASEDKVAKICDQIHELQVKMANDEMIAKGKTPPAVAATPNKGAESVPAATPPATPPKQVAVAPNATTYPVIFIGDSRMVQMHEAMGNTGVYYVAENAKGYDWLTQTAIAKVDPFVGKGTKIVINLGVNDTKNADKYITYVNAKANEWKSKGAKVYYATVNPVWNSPYVSDYQVSFFNTKLAQGLSGVKIIDTYSYLISHGYNSPDGLHYDATTSSIIYNLIMQNI